MEINNCFLQMQNPNGVKDLPGVEVFKQARWSTARPRGGRRVGGGYTGWASRAICPRWMAEPPG